MDNQANSQSNHWPPNKTQNAKLQIQSQLYTTASPCLLDQFQENPRKKYLPTNYLAFEKARRRKVHYIAASEYPLVTSAIPRIAIPTFHTSSIELGFQ